MATVQFVDSIVASPTVLLDCNSPTGSFMLQADGIDMSPPPFRRQLISNAMTEGEDLADLVAGNRVVKFGVQVLPASGSSIASAVRTLGRLLRNEAILKVQLNGAPGPVFFQTLPAPDWAHVMDRLQAARSSARLEIPAKPFALGLETVIGNAISVNNDPAAGSNPLYFDTGVIGGDVETPLYLRTSTDLSGATCIIGVRRHGTVTNFPAPDQAESMTMGTNTTTQAYSSLASGGGGTANNWVRCTFGTTGWATRLSGVVPDATATADMRGRYAAYARVKKSAANGSVMQARLQLGAGSSIYGPSFVVPESTTWQYMRVGEFQVPFGFKGEQDGYGPALPAGPLTAGLQATLVSGSASLDVDCLAWLPADEELVEVQWTSQSGSTFVMDGPNDDCYLRSATPAAVSATVGFPQFPGGLPYLAPGIANRVFFIDKDGPLIQATTFYASYWPRYLWVV